MKCWTFLLALGATMFARSACLAQAPPFTGGGGVGFAPEISVVDSGALLDAQVVVSHDRRYVTINMRADVSRVQALDVFPVSGFTTGGGGGAGLGGASLGFVGGAGFIEDDEMVDVLPGSAAPKTSAAAAERKTRTPERAPGGPTAHVQSSPSEILKTDTTAADSVLRKEGMFRIATLD